MMATAFLAFLISMLLALSGRQRTAFGVAMVAIGWSIVVFGYHFTDRLDLQF